MSVAMVVVFQVEDADLEVWSGPFPVDEFGMQSGDVTEIRFVDSEHDLVAQAIVEIIRTSISDDGTPVILGETGPLTDPLRELLPRLGWERLSRDGAEAAVHLVQTTPPAAAVHEVLLVIGSPSEDAPVNAWSATATPDSPQMPMVGERLLLDLENFTIVSGIGDTLADPSSEHDGVPALVFWSAKVEAGIGQVGIWVPEADITETELVTGGWERLGEDELDAQAFHLIERIDLARRTHLDLRLDDDGDAYIHDYTLDDPLSVSDEQMELLPPGMQIHVSAARDFANAESIMASWGKDA